MYISDTITCQCNPALGLADLDIGTKSIQSVPCPFVAQTPILTF